MYLAFAIGAAPGSSADLKWWFGHAASAPAALRARLAAGLPVRVFDPQSAGDREAERERLYDFLHEAEARGQQLVAYEIEPGTELEDLDDSALEPIPIENVRNCLRSMEITEYQTRHHDEGDQPHYDPDGYADQLAAARQERWGATSR